MLTPGAAMTRFGLVGTALNELTREDVMAAWRHAVRTAHPDVTVIPGGPLLPSATMAELKDARDVLLNAVTQRDCACKTCRGTGKVRGQVGLRRCTACAGTGDSR